MITYEKESTAQHSAIQGMTNTTHVSDGSGVGSNDIKIDQEADNHIMSSQSTKSRDATGVKVETTTPRDAIVVRGNVNESNGKNWKT